MPRIIDAHQHFWSRTQPFDYAWLDSPDKAPIRHDHLPGDLKPLLDHAGVDASLCVQTQHNLQENRWALELVQRHPFLAGVVGWVDLASPECEQQLLEFKANPRFVGVRHITQDEPDDDFIIRPEVLRGLRVLEKHSVPFDLLFYVRHLEHVPMLARHLPALRMVIDHLAKPDIRHRRFDEWIPAFREAARFPNIFCKLSGLITEADWRSWSVADLKHYVDAALECFGPDRCMFGSDWPVCKLAGSYHQVKSSLETLLSSTTPRERDAVMGETAARFYALPPV
jgi:L-fuconolactonase